MTERHSHTFSVAPMMDWTDRHCRAFHRQITQKSVLYTEMVTADAVWFGERERLIGFDDCEHPVALQLGGSNPDMLAKAAVIGEEFGYDEINLNVGCPSDRVQSGKFGACLMAEPELVAQCISAMNNTVQIPVTVKCRIGIDDQDEEEDLARFIEIVKSAGCELFIVHARKAWLKGLSPKENRDIPPLDYARVYWIKKVHPDLRVIINGGIETLDACEEHLHHVDGVMLGREAYKHPYVMAEVDRRLYGSDRTVDRKEAVEQYFPYMESQLAKGTRLHSMIRHMLGLFQGQPGAKLWRRHLSENAHHPDAGLDILRQALDYVK